MPDPAKFLSEMKESSGSELSGQWVKVEEFYLKRKISLIFFLMLACLVASLS